MRNNLQKEIQSWWESNPMTYDWRKTMSFSENSREFFQEIDRRFFSSAFYAQNAGEKPFSGLIDYASLKGKDVLEVGCGMGSHAMLLARAGCHLTAIDLTSKAVEYTRRRFCIFGLKGNILRSDAETLPFDDSSFDFVWSWGVIHHSSNPMRALAEICRVLRPGGRASFMMYHRASLCYWVNFFLVRGIFMGKLLTKSMEELANTYSDGRVARYYTRKEVFHELTRYCEDVRIKIFGQLAELLPLPRLVREPIISLIPTSLKQSILSCFGSFLFATGTKRKNV